MSEFLIKFRKRIGIFMQPVIMVITIHKALTEMLSSLFLTVRVPIFSINTNTNKHYHTCTSIRLPD